MGFGRETVEYAYNLFVTYLKWNDADAVVAKDMGSGSRPGRPLPMWLLRTGCVWPLGALLWPPLLQVLPATGASSLQTDPLWRYAGRRC